jgi:transposase-like protein
MAACPKCGTEVSKPDKNLKGAFFRIESFKCPKCKWRFNETHSLFIDTQLATTNVQVVSYYAEESLKPSPKTQKRHEKG